MDRVVLVDGGGFNGKQDATMEARGLFVLEWMKSYGYDAVTIGETELKLGEDLLRALAADPSIPFVSANIYDIESGELLFPQKRIVEKNGVKIAITAVTAVGAGTEPSFERAGLRTGDVDESIGSLLKELDGRADVVVLLARMSSQDARALGERHRGLIDAVVVGNNEFGRGVVHPENGGAVYVAAGNRGQSLGVTRIAFAEKGIDRITGDELVLSKDLPEKEEVLVLVEEFHRNLNALLKEHAVDTTISRASPDGHYFLSARSCADCHQREYTIWQETPHAHAFETLVRAGMESLPECFGCHVTGHGDPAGYLPADENSFDLINVQCEVCHDKGSRHSRSGEYGSSLLMNACVTCHDAENSPDFDPEVYWRMIEH